jgi:hypothetical protein
VTPAGRKLDQHLNRSIKQFKGYPMAGGKFFALIDELKASEERLDALAEPLLEKLAHTEAAAKVAVEAKHATIDAAADYIKRMSGITEKLGEGSNGGPTLPGASAALSQSDEQKTETKE